MLINNEIDVDSFNKVFIKKFSSFCEKSPLTLSFVIYGTTVKVTDSTYEDETWQKDFDLLYEYDVKVNIKRIKEVLEQRYPIISTTIVKPISDDKAAELSLKGVPIDEIMDMTEEIVVDKYKIVKVINDSNEIILIDLEDYTCKIFGVRIPVIMFIDMVYHDKEALSKIISDDNKFYFKKILTRVNH